MKQAAASPNPTVRFRAVWILGKIGSADAFDVLLQAVSDPDERVRYDAAMALGQLKDSRAIVPLIEVIKRIEEDPDLAGAAGDALYRFGPEALPALRGVAEGGNLRAAEKAAHIIDAIENPQLY